MPTFDELIAKSKKKFKKSEYRPWNYMDELDKEQQGRQVEDASDEDEISLGSENNANIYKPTNNVKISKGLFTAVNSSNQVVVAQNNVIDNQTVMVEKILRLTGHQKAIFLFVVECCISRGALTTGIITAEILVGITNTTSKMVKTSIKRLISKDLIKREKGKTGRGGFYIFSINAQIQSATLDYQRLFNGGYMEVNRVSYRNQSQGNLEAKSVHVDRLPPEWKRINFEPLEHIGFSETQIFQLYDKQSNSPEIVQDSIFRFAFGLENNDKLKAYDNPLNVLMGVLRKGASWTEPNYEAPHDKALRELVEETRKKEAKRQALINELFEREFPVWESGLHQDEIKLILPEEVSTSGVKGWITSTLKTHYKEKILIPRLKEQGLINTDHNETN